MTLYAGIDLHSNNSYVCVIGEQDRRILERRFRNEAPLMTGALARYRDGLQGVAVESTFNWYWLADALRAARFDVRLVNPAKVAQYQGLKRTDDRLSPGAPAAPGAVINGVYLSAGTAGVAGRAAQTAQQVQDCSRHLLSFKTQYQRLTGRTVPVHEVKARDFVCPVLGDANMQLALQSNLRMSRCLNDQVGQIERAVAGT